MTYKSRSYIAPIRDVWLRFFYVANCNFSNYEHMGITIGYELSSHAGRWYCTTKKMGSRLTEAAYAENNLF